MEMTRKSGQALPNMKILLVEDDPADARLMQRAFGKADLQDQYIRVANGDEAVAYMEGDVAYADRMQFPLPSLMILDIKLPRRSGLEVLIHVRSMEDPRRRTPVVMLTSSKEPADLNRAYDFGANSFLTKPHTSAELNEMVFALKSYWLEMNEPPNTTVGK
jgi:CheY-like chemotaxis protein